MKVLIVGDHSQLAEASTKWVGHDLLHAANYTHLSEPLKSCDIVFDFIADASQIEVYTTGKPVFLNSVMTTLKKICAKSSDQGLFFGFNGMPTFLDRQLLEVTLLKEDQQQKLSEICHDLKTEYQLVKDTVGMVTPRIICMIINEAYCTVEEGTATREDIDLAMKTGTNYPYGPFNWGRRIGLKNVHQLLNNVLKDTGDERYNICKLLAAEARA